MLYFLYWDLICFQSGYLMFLSSVESADSQVRCKALIDFTEQNMYMWKKMTDLTTGSQARIQRLRPLILTDVSCQTRLDWSAVRLLYPDPTIIKCAQTVFVLEWTYESTQCVLVSGPNNLINMDGPVPVKSQLHVSVFVCMCVHICWQ